MTRLSQMAIAGSGCLLGAIACSEEYRGNDTSTATIQAACDRYAESICNRYATCVPAIIQRSFGGPVTCREGLARVCAAAYQTRDSRFDDRRTQACVDKLGTLDCTSLLELDLPKECAPAGDRPVGSACVTDEQCTTSTCRNQDPLGCGVCIEPAAEGEACGSCALGLVCMGGICIRRGRLGDACEAARPCASNHRCVGGTCAAKLGPDQPCEASACDDTRGLYCGPRGRCESFRYAADGEACGVVETSQGVACTAGQCVGATRTTGRCVRSADVGEACAPERQCYAYLQCIAGECVVADDSFCR